jgi:hypothetical protein
MFFVSVGPRLRHDVLSPSSFVSNDFHRAPRSPIHGEARSPSQPIPISIERFHVDQSGTVLVAGLDDVDIATDVE